VWPRDGRWSTAEEERNSPRQATRPSITRRESGRRTPRPRRCTRLPAATRTSSCRTCRRRGRLHSARAARRPWSRRKETGRRGAGRGRGRAEVRPPAAAACRVWPGAGRSRATTNGPYRRCCGNRTSADRPVIRWTTTATWPSGSAPPAGTNRCPAGRRSACPPYPGERHRLNIPLPIVIIINRYPHCAGLPPRARLRNLHRVIIQRLRHINRYTANRCGRAGTAIATNGANYGRPNSNNIVYAFRQRVSPPTGPRTINSPVNT